MGKDIRKMINIINEINQNKLIAYHGSNSVFDKFDINRIGGNSDINFKGNLNNDKHGFFFTSDYDEAKSTANVVSKKKGGKPIIYTCELTLKNSYTLADLQNDIGDDAMEIIYNKTHGNGWGIFDTNRELIINNTIKLGKDSIVFTNQGIKFIVVLNESQINIIDTEEFEVKYSFRDK